MKFNLIQGIAVETLAEGLPTNIQWMPPGKSTITTRGPDGSPVTREIEVDEETSLLISDLFNDMTAKAAAGQGDIPYFDFNHDGGPASAHPMEIYWAGDSAIGGGIRARVRWTSQGEAAITGRTYRRFSPEFYVDDDNQIVGIGPNMGGLVNQAAFRQIEPIWARDYTRAWAWKLAPQPSGQVLAVGAGLFVKRAMQEGRIPENISPQLVQGWTEFYMRDPVRAEAALPQPNPRLVDMLRKRAEQAIAPIKPPPRPAPRRWS